VHNAQVSSLTHKTLCEIKFACEIKAASVVHQTKSCSTVHTILASSTADKEKVCILHVWNN